VILPSSTDRAPVIGYHATIDVSALADGNCTYNGEVCPRVGGDSHVLRSAGGTIDGRRVYAAIVLQGSDGYNAVKRHQSGLCLCRSDGGKNGTVDAMAGLAG